jgi:malonyl CoA-acyl carrier protein transacylase
MPSTLAEAAPPPAPPARGWDSELFVLRADDRAALREQALALAASVERQPAVPLAELAAALAAELRPGGARLAVVATSAEDLLKKLRRAAERLGDPKCKLIRDAGGAYYFSAPLAEQGTVALLFPGEGAQYLNMLADLCGAFPEVEETFAWCDRLAAEAGRPEASLRRTLHLPPGASEEEKAAAEAELRRLGPSIFGVLLADQAIYRVLEKLRVPASAMAGHSAGELGALLASGAMSSQGEHGSSLPEIMDLMQSQEGEAGGPDVALLAVGASKATIQEVAGEAAGGAVVVAMDNCPHQCVAVGPTHLAAAVESALAERGVICERLPYKRPYHTPLFEPYMGAFRELFAGVPFREPHTPVYCCSTGEPFPREPDAIRRLAVNHWVTPVEFTRMIETMHADGVRLFVECGPRGNLSAFVEDILRGRPFAAIPANLPRKSGPTQVNHMVAQLVAHGVELNLGALWEGRVGETPASQPLPQEGVAGGAVGSPSAPGEGEAEAGIGPASEGKAEGFSPPLPLGDGGWGSSPAVLHTYLDVMEQFLDAQREVMSAFLGGGGSGPSLPPELFASLAAFDLGPLAEPDQSPPATPHTPLPPFCLVGEVVRHEPGREITFRRAMDGREDLYADDHTLGGRGVSREDPAQNGLPVLPMTFSLEAMSEAAATLAPGKVVVAIKNVRLYRWLPFDPEPTTLEVRASVASVDPESGRVEVRADVRDLGNSFLKDGAGKPACEAVVVLADAYPPAPAPRPFALTDEAACESSVEDLRRNMFHGPTFQMITSLGRTGREGIDGTLEVKPRDGWFRSNPDPRVAIDPVLTDAAMHVLGAWHLEQPDWTGRILLPIGVKSLEFFGPPPPAGTRFSVRGHNEHEDARQVRHGVELFDANGRVWMRLVGAGYWRFYLPFGDVNFFGPKDQYFLSSRVPGAESPGAEAARCYYIEPPLDLQQPVLRASGVRVTMTPREIAEFNARAGSEQDRSDWFFGRMLAKDAVRAAWNARHGESIFPADMETDERDGRIVCRPRGAPRAEPFPPVRVAIAGGKVAAFSSFTGRPGLALVAIAKGATAEDERAARAAAARGAVADALGIAPEGCTLASLDAETGAAVVGAAGERFRAQTAREKDAVIATTLCEAA